MSETTTQTSHKVNGEAFGERLSSGRLKSEYYEPIPPEHFLPKPGDQILDIGIIGSGIAGLAAAIGLIQSGHNVEVSPGYESQDAISADNASSMKGPGSQTR